MQKLSSFVLMQTVTGICCLYKALSLVDGEQNLRLFGNTVSNAKNNISRTWCLCSAAPKVASQ